LQTVITHSELCEKLCVLCGYIFYRKERQEKYAKNTKASTLGKFNKNLPQHIKIRMSLNPVHATFFKNKNE